MMFFGVTKQAKDEHARERRRGKVDERKRRLDERDNDRDARQSWLGRQLWGLR